MDVLAALPQIRPVSLVVAVAHLLTPVDVTVGQQMRVTEEGVWWRGEHTRVLDSPTYELVAAVRAVVTQGRTSADRFLTVGTDPVGWFKLVRSGTHLHLCGARELFGGQHVTFALDVPVAVAQVVGRMVADGHRLTRGVLHAGGHQVQVSADSRSAHLSAAR